MVVRHVPSACGLRTVEPSDQKSMVAVVQAPPSADVAAMDTPVHPLIEPMINAVRTMLRRIITMIVADRKYPRSRRSVSLRRSRLAAGDNRPLIFAAAAPSPAPRRPRDPARAPLRALRERVRRDR